MGSPLGPTLANAFLLYFEENWLQDGFAYLTRTFRSFPKFSK